MSVAAAAARPRAELHEGDAFGLRIAGNRDVAGLGPLTSRPERHVELHIQEGGSDLGRVRGAHVFGRLGTGRVPVLQMDHRSEGYGIWSPRSGRFVISDDGRSIRAVVPVGRRWPWRLLFAQALPIAACLQGLEVLHASAVAIGDSAVLFAGPSGAGKSTVAMELVSRGAGLIADDVVALEIRDGALFAHPGVGVVNLTTEASRRLGDRGRTIARTFKQHVEVDRAPGALPVRRLYLLDRRDRPGDPRVEEVEHPDPRWLLGNTFVVIVQDPRRLIRQLDIHQALSVGVRTARLRARLDSDPQALAATVEADCMELESLC